jgi:hypothetical protein
MFTFYARTKKPLKNAFVGMSTGLVALGATKLLATIIGFTFTINFFSTFVSVVVGIPGVISMVVYNFMFAV